MATSLQKQLAAIAASSTHELDLKAQRSLHSQSLIFEPQIAISQSFDTLYQICSEGFADLCALDSRFVPFQRSLFSPQSKDEDRNRMTKRENEELDNMLDSFLSLVGARLALSPAVKAVEWLVRRFRIHEHNTSATILTFLPYHSTSMFPTLLSILPKELPVAFRFLHLYQQRLACPPHDAIVHGANLNNDFFISLNKYVLTTAKISHHHHNLIAFWAPVIVQSVDARLDSTLKGRLNIQAQRQEELLNILIPSLSDGLAMRHAPEVQLGCYMIVAVLVKRATLSLGTAQALISAISLGWSDHTIEAALSCLAVITDAVPAVRLPRACIRAIISHRGSCKALSNLKKEQSIDSLMLGAAMGALECLKKRDVEDAIQFLEELSSRALLSGSAKRTFVETLQSRVITDRLVGDHQGVQRLQLLVASDPRPSGNAVDVEPDESESDTFMIDSVDTTPAVQDHYQRLQSSFEALDLKSIKKHQTFFCKGSDDAFKQIATLIVPALEGKMDPLLILKVTPVFEETAASGSSILSSFLARAWCYPHMFSHETRVKFAQAYRRYLQDSKVQPSALLALLPYVLLALTDVSPRVRREASRLLVDIDSALRIQSASNLPSSPAGFDIYGTLDEAPPTDSLYIALHKFLSSCLIPKLNECQANASFIGQLLHLALDSSSKGGDLPKQLKADQKTTVFEYLVSHTIAQPLPLLKTQLIRLLTKVEHVTGKSRSAMLFTCLRNWLESERATVTEGSFEASAVIMTELDATFLSIVQVDDTAAVSLLEAAAFKTQTYPEGVCLAALRRLRHLLANFDDAHQRVIASQLLDESTDPAVSPKIQSEATKILRSMSRVESIFQPMLEETALALEQAHAGFSRKKRRNDNGAAERLGLDDESQVAILCLSKANVLLETLDATKPQASERLLNNVLRLFSAIHSLANKSSIDLGYLESQSLEVLSHLMGDFQTRHVTPKIHNSSSTIDIIVDSIRKTSSSQTRNSALLLLSKIVHFVPHHALQNLIPIFTFVSTTTAHNSDEFAAHVVDQTMREVIPVLSAALRKRDQDVAEATSEIILSFAAAFDHIPSQRKLQLFTLLAESLGPQDCLFAIVTALVDRNLSENDMGAFVGQLLCQFSPLTIVATCGKYLDLILESTKAKSRLFQVYVYSATDPPTTATSIQGLLNAMSQALNNSLLRQKILKATKKVNLVDDLTVQFGNVLERALRLTKSDQLEAVRRSSAGLLEQVLVITPFDQLVSSATELLHRSENDVQTGILRALERRIKSSTSFSTPNAKAAIRFLPQLSALLPSVDGQTLQCNIVSCMDQISEKFGATETAVTSSAAKSILNAINFREASTLLRAISLHCLASTIQVLQNDFAPLLTRTITASVACLSSLTGQRNTEQERLHNAACAVITSALEYVSFLMPKQAIRDTLQILHLPAGFSLGREAQENLNQLVSLAAQKLDLKMAVGAFIHTWHSAVRGGPKSLHLQLDFLKAAIDRHTKSEISRDSSLIFEAIIISFDIRQSAADNDLTEEQIDSLEQHAVSTLVAFILKVNDLIFRPLFSKLIDWVSNGDGSDANMTLSPRARTFFAFLYVFSERLRSIVTSYFDAPLDLGMTILNIQPDKTMQTQILDLKRTVLSALSSAFANDQDDFFASPHRFNRIHEPLTGQLALHAPNVHFVTSAAVPALSSFAVAVSASPDHLKALNATLLTLLKHDSAKVRFAAIKAEMDLANRLGEEWLALLPEMLPVISELQEDGDEGVERETIRWVKKVEEMLGESLDGMLT